MQRMAFSTTLALAAAVLLVAAAQAAPVNTTGHWGVQLTSGEELSTGVLTLNQVGLTVIGKAGSTIINGKMVSDTKMNATWNGPKGAGWMTVNFSAVGTSLQGSWGFNGRKSSGDFVGKRIPEGST